VVANLVSIQPNAVNLGFRLLFRAEGPVLPAQAEGLGNGTPRQAALKGRFIGLAMKRPYRAQRLFYRHGHKPRPLAWAVWTTPSGSRSPYRLRSVTAFGW